MGVRDADVDLDQQNKAQQSSNQLNSNCFFFFLSFSLIELIKADSVGQRDHVRSSFFGRNAEFLSPSSADLGRGSAETVGALVGAWVS